MALFHRYWSVATVTSVSTKLLSGGLLASMFIRAWQPRLHGVFELQQQCHDVRQVHQQVLLNMCFYIAFDVRLWSIDIGVYEFILASIG